MKCPDCKIGDLSIIELEYEGAIIIECSQHCIIDISNSKDAEKKALKILLYNYNLQQANYRGKNAVTHNHNQKNNPYYKDEALAEAWDAGYTEMEFKIQNLLLQDKKEL